MNASNRTVNSVERTPIRILAFWGRVFLPVLSFLIVCLNLLLIHGLRKTNRNLNLSQKLYTYLACTDIMQCLLSAFFCIFELLFKGDRGLGKVVQVFTVTSVAFMVYTGAGTLIVISIIRNLAIRKPLLETKWKWVMKRLVGWFCYAVICSVFQMLIHLPATQSYNLMFWGLLITSCHVLILVTCILSYNIWSVKCLTGRDGGNCTRHKRNVKAVGTLNLITLLYVLCFFPLCVYYLTMALFMKQNVTLFREGIMFYSLFNSYPFCCPGFNAIIYVKRDKKILRYYKNWFCSLLSLPQTRDVYGMSLRHS